MQPVVLSVLPRKGQERKEASFADLIFGSFHQGKEQSQPAAIERVNVGNLAPKIN
jgi:hypothetical protein